jgi:hypothetical protein
LAGSPEVFLGDPLMANLSLGDGRSVKLQGMGALWLGPRFCDERLRNFTEVTVGWVGVAR